MHTTTSGMAFGNRENHSDAWIFGRRLAVGPRRGSRILGFAAGFGLGLGLIGAGEAADWNQYRGPSGNGSSPEPILKSWPAQGPRVVWRVPTPLGFSSFSKSDGRVFTQVAREVDGVLQEVCAAFDAETGKEIWAAPLGLARYGHDGGNAGAPGNNGGDGPRSTPSAEEGRVYVLSSELTLSCFQAADGKTIWSKNLVKEHGAKNISWKNAASPLIEGGLIFVCGGGAGQSLLALDKRDGRAVWKGEDDAMTHATPVAATIHGVRQVIFFTQKGLVSAAAESGKVLWRHPFPFKVSTAASPVVGGDIVYCSAGYGVGAGAVRIEKSGGGFAAVEIWRKPGDRELPNHWSTPVYHDGHLYGMFSFKEYGKGPVKCVELATGKIAWSQEGFGAGNVILADGHLVVLGDAGQLALVEATPERYKELARADVLEGKCWSTPILSEGRIYARSTREGVCLDIAVKSAGK